MLPVIPKQHFVEKCKFFPKGKLTLYPFTVGQESLFLQVKDSKDENEKLAALKQIISECIDEKQDSGELPLFLIDLLFIRLRQHSVGELVELSYQCRNTVKKEDGTEKECGGKLNLNIDLRKVQLKEYEGHTDRIMVTDTLGLKFKYPTINSITDRKPGSSDADIIVSCIESIYDDSQVWMAADHEPAEMQGFYKNVSLLKKAEIAEKFFGKMPHIYYEDTLKCPHCGKEHPIKFKSLAEVFH